MVALIIALLTGLTVSDWILLSPEVNWEVWSESVSHSVMSDSLRLHSLPGSSVRGNLQARILEWVAMPSPPGDLPNPGIELWSPALHADSLPSEPSGKPQWPLSKTTQPECPLQSKLEHFWVGFLKTGLPSQPVFRVSTPDRFLVLDKASECDSAICSSC